MCFFGKPGSDSTLLKELLNQEELGVPEQSGIKHGG
jgi:hypothetical protein